MELVELAAMTATGLSATSVLPQVRRLIRTGDAVGVSMATATLGVASEASWIAYTLQRQLWGALPVAAVMVAANLLLAGTIRRAGVPPTGAVVAGVAWAGGLIAVTMAGGWGALGAVLGVGYAVQVGPAVWAAYRTWAPSGIAPATWAATLAECGLWGVYALARADPALMGLAIVGTAASSAVLVRWFATRARFAPTRRTGESPSAMRAPAPQFGAVSR
jgi:hypothetical protein